MRNRAALWTPGQPPNSPYHWPDLGTKRAGGAERCADPAGPKRIEVALTVLDSYAQRLRALEWAMITTATPQDAHTLPWLQTVPGLGQSLRLGLLSARHDLARFPRGQ